MTGAKYTTTTGSARSVPVLDSDHYSGVGVLCCPHCGNANLHQSRAEVFFRSEDCEQGIYAGISGEAEMCMTQSSQKGNPSPRRDGIRVWFTCEHCPKHSSLAIIQHKGDTQMYWEAK